MEAAMEEAILKRELPHSVELSRNAKGEFSWTIKRYYATGEEEDATRIIREINAHLIQQLIL
jgi:hypothetical protein